MGIKGLTLKQITGKKYNLSYHLILPMMPGNIDQYMPEHIIDVYCRHNNKSCIAILYREALEEKFKDLLTAFYMFRNFYDMSSVDNNILVKFDIPEVYVSDFYLIIDGKYSKISNMLKGAIRNFHNLKIDAPICSIIYRYPERRAYLERRLDVELSDDSELFDKFNLKENTYE